MSYDLAENPEAIGAFFTDNGYPWPAFLGNSQVLADYKVLVQDTKLAIDRRGVIVFRRGYGIISPQEWERLFQDLSAR